MVLKVCKICLNENLNFTRCIQCKKGVCSDCDQKIGECPFCRCALTGRKLSDTRISNLHHYFINYHEAVYYDHERATRISHGQYVRFHAVKMIRPPFKSVTIKIN